MAWEPVPDPDQVGSPAPPRTSCPRCGSERLRRSAPRGLGERVLRSLSPVHFYRCRVCGHRGWHLGTIGRVHREKRPAEVPGRPVEKRDLEARRAKRARAVVAVAAAVGLGVAAGFLIQSCQQRAPATLPTRK